MTEIPEHFKELFESSLLSEMAEKTIRKSIKEGDSYLQYGNHVNAMPLVLSGLMKVVRIDESGKELLLYYLGENEGCAMTFTCCMERQPSQISIVAEEDSELLLVPIELMDGWTDKFPSWKSFVMQTIRNRFDELLGAIDQIAFHKLDDRLVNYLQEKADATGSPLLNLSHGQIANDLATSREVVSRLLKKLENDGRLLLYRNQVKLLSKM